MRIQWSNAYSRYSTLKVMRSLLGVEYFIVSRKGMAPAKRIFLGSVEPQQWVFDRIRPTFEDTRMVIRYYIDFMEGK